MPTAHEGFKLWIIRIRRSDIGAFQTNTFVAVEQDWVVRAWIESRGSTWDLEVYGAI